MAFKRVKIIDLRKKKIGKSFIQYFMLIFVVVVVCRCDVSPKLSIRFTNHNRIKYDFFCDENRDVRLHIYRAREQCALV